MVCHACAFGCAPRELFEMDKISTKTNIREFGFDFDLSQNLCTVIQHPQKYTETTEIKKVLLRPSKSTSVQSFVCMGRVWQHPFDTPQKLIK